MTRFTGSTTRVLPLPFSARLALGVALIVFLVPIRAFAQRDSGSIVGDVTDGQGGVLPGVAVVATQEGTGFSFTATTNDKGQYSFRNLRIGSYVVRNSPREMQFAVKLYF